MAEERGDGIASDEDAETKFRRLARELQELRAQLSTRWLGPKPEHNLSRDKLHDRHTLR